MPQDPKQKLFKIINQFQDQAAALEINELLLELEKTNPKEFYIIYGRLISLVKHGRDLEDLE